MVLLIRFGIYLFAKCVCQEVNFYKQSRELKKCLAIHLQKRSSFQLLDFYLYGGGRVNLHP